MIPTQQQPEYYLISEDELKGIMFVAETNLITDIDKAIEIHKAIRSRPTSSPERQRQLPCYLPALWEGHAGAMRRSQNPRRRRPPLHAKTGEDPERKDHDKERRRRTRGAAMKTETEIKERLVEIESELRHLANKDALELSLSVEEYEVEDALVAERDALIWVLKGAL
jgi:hypothetical protein